MNWKTIVALPAVGLTIWIVVAAVEFGAQVGATWTAGTTSTIVNGLVMVCFGGTMFGVFVLSLIVGTALATRILASAPRQAVRDPLYDRPSLWDRMRGRRGEWDQMPQGWRSDPVLDDLQRGGRVVGVEGPLRPLLPYGQGGYGQAGYGQGGMLPPPASGAFDGMEDGGDSRFGGG
jgi:hypothetical protein